MKSALRWFVRRIGYDIVQYVDMPEYPFGLMCLLL